MKRLALVLGVLLAALVSGQLIAATVTVHVGSYYFEDATVGDGMVVANVGDQLRFLIDDNGATKPHTVVVTALGIDSGPLLAGSTFITPVLDTPGTYTLFCRVHRYSSNHYTTLIVKGTAATPKPTPAPTPRPSPTRSAPSPTPGATAGVTPAPGSSPKRSPGVATAAPGSSEGVIESPPPAATNGTPGPLPSGGDAESTGEPLASGDKPLPPGITGPPTLVWLRSAIVGGLALPGLVIVAVLAWIAANRRRSRSDT